MVDGVAAEAVARGAVGELCDEIARGVADDEVEARVGQRESTGRSLCDLRAAEGGMVCPEVAAAEDDEGVAGGNVR